MRFVGILTHNPVAYGAAALHRVLPIIPRLEGGAIRYPMKIYSCLPLLELLLLTAKTLLLLLTCLPASATLLLG